MEKPFTIEFNFPLAGTDYLIPITATAEFNQPYNYYKVHSFRSSHTASAEPSILPVQYIKKREEQTGISWVDRDSGRFTTLIDAIGAAIETREEAG